MKLKALDTLRMSSAVPNRVLRDETFEINDQEAEDLVRRGLAEKVKRAPANKARARPANKVDAKKGPK